MKFDQLYVMYSIFVVINVYSCRFLITFNNDCSDLTVTFVAEVKEIL